LENERNYNREKMDHKFLNNLEHFADEFFYNDSDFGSTIYSFVQTLVP
jgi:hypothetical protein